MPGKLLVFCGIPGCGKTTIAALVAKANGNAVHIQTDAVRTLITEPTYSEGESSFVYDACVAVAKEELDHEYLVILDATFGSNRRRQSVLSVLAGHYTKADFVHVMCDIETALRRNSTRSRPVREETVRGIWSSFEEPEGAVTVDSTATSPEEAAKQVVRGLSYLSSPPER